MIIKTICTLEKHELDALKTLAGVSCSNISCYDCPLKTRTLESEIEKQGRYCLVNASRAILDGQNINYKGV